MKAFTLIELLIVIAIIGILASVIVVSFSDNSASARKAKAEFNVAQAARNIQVEKADINTTAACPSGTFSPDDDKSTLYCIYNGGNFVVYEIFGDVTGTSTDNAYCMDEDSGSPELTNYTSSTATVTASTDCDDAL